MLGPADSVLVVTSPQLRCSIEPRRLKLSRRRVAEGDGVAALHAVLGHLRRLHLDAEAVAAVVDAPVLEAERAARPGIGGVTGAEAVAMAAAGIGTDADRHGVGVAVGLARQHLQVGEILRVIQRELRAQHLRQIEVLPLLVAQVAAHQAVAHHALGDARLAEAIARAGVELERDVRGVVGGIHDQLIAHQARIQIAVGGGGALQVGLDVLVGLVVQPLAALERQAPQDAPEQRVVRAGPLDPHVDVIHQHRLPGGNVDHDVPHPPLPLGDGGLHLGLVVTKGLERGIHLALDPVVQPLDGVGVELGAALHVALEAQVREHVVAHLVADAMDLHVDAARGLRQARREQAQQDRRGPHVPSTNPRRVIALRHQTCCLEKPRNSRASAGQPLAAVH